MSNSEDQSEDLSALKLATRPQVVKTATMVALTVGTVLALINHGPAIIDTGVNSTMLLQIGLTYLVPYGVSSYSSVRTLQHTGNRQHRTPPIGR